jgi:hypothetical protein
MIYSNAIALVLALAPATLFAAPTKFSSVADLISRRGIPAQALKALEDGNCDLDALTLPIAPTPLPAPGAGLKVAHIALGRGTQNYTCTTGTASETPVQVGAIATLYNATCQAVRAPAVLANITTLALSYALPASDIADHLLSGHHLFTASGAPFFNMDTEQAKYGWIQAAKNASSPAPEGCSKGTNGLGSVPWLKLNSTGGDYKEVYRVETAGGVAPKTCEGLTGAFTVEYSSLYWFFK